MLFWSFQFSITMSSHIYSSQRKGAVLPVEEAQVGTGIEAKISQAITRVPGH